MGQASHDAGLFVRLRQGPACAGKLPVHLLAWTHVPCINAGASVLPALRIAIRARRNGWIVSLCRLCFTMNIESTRCFTANGFNCYLNEP